MPARPQPQAAPSTYDRPTIKLSGSGGPAAEGSPAGEATRSALNSALGRWAEAGGIGGSRDGAEELGSEPRWTAGMWQER